MDKFKIVKDIFSKINYFTFQYEDGHFSNVSSFYKVKDKPNKLYNFTASMRYCKCCNVLYSTDFSIGKTIYYWSTETEGQDNSKVNFDNEKMSFKVISFDEIIKIMKENINV